MTCYIVVKYGTRWIILWMTCARKYVKIDHALRSHRGRVYFIHVCNKGVPQGWVMVPIAFSSGLESVSISGGQAHEYKVCLGPIANPL